MSYHLIDLVQRLGHPRILVLGDLILDRYIWGDAERISQEAPVILLREDRQEVRLGGAANVANMLRGLDADVVIAGVVGADEAGRTIRAEFRRVGVDESGLVEDASRPTTVKQRFIGRAQHRHPHQILRVDREVRTPLHDAVADRLWTAVESELPRVQAILVSDYAKGVCTPGLLRRLIGAARAAGIPLIVDPAPSGDYAVYRGATAVTPNRLESSRATGRTIATAEDAFAAGRELCARLELAQAYITLDRDGIALVNGAGECHLLSTRKREVYDITGAGDMVLAMIGVGTAAGISPVDLARLANVAGGLEVEQIGVVCISRQEILADLITGGRNVREKVCSLDVLMRYVQARRSLGQKIVFTNGCFDLLHPGHVHTLQEAAALGDCLIVAVNGDASVRRLKGPDRPVINETHRAGMLAALECVDHAIIFHEDTPHALLERVRPDVLVKGGTTTDIVAREIVEKYGGTVRLLSTLADISTTRIVHDIRAAREAA